MPNDTAKRGSDVAVDGWATPDLVDLGSALEIIQGGGDCCLDGHKGYKGNKDSYTDGGDLLDDIA